MVDRALFQAYTDHKKTDEPKRVLYKNAAGGEIAYDRKDTVRETGKDTLLGQRISLLYGDPDIMTYMPCGCLTDEEIRTYLQKITSDWNERPQHNYEMAVICKSDSKKIGRARIHMGYESDTAMIGWLLIQSEWNKGYATEITKSLLEYCFKILKVHRVCALCHPQNIGSRRVLEKCGLRQEAHYIKSVKYSSDANGHWEDELEYAILREESV